SATEIAPESTSTIFTTVVYTITSCHPTVTNCSMGHLTTDTLCVYTTICPAENTLAPTQAAYPIGILVTVIIDITVEIVVNEISGLTETFFITDTILVETASLYNTATEGQPCYTCALTSEGFTCPNSDVTATRTLCISSPSNGPPSNTTLVIQTCATCSPITLDSNPSPITPPISEPTDTAVLPQQQNPESPPLMSSIDLSEEQPIIPILYIPANNPLQASNTGSRYAAGTNLPPPRSSISGVISPSIHNGGARVLRYNALLVVLGVLG
ncbi:hypothetical protein N431DRAFT_312709, partial [Stipitochalara longipes BDJ]